MDQNHFRIVIIQGDEVTQRDMADILGKNKAKVADFDKNFPSLQIEKLSTLKQGLKKIQSATQEKKGYSLVFIDISDSRVIKGLDVIRQMLTADDTLQVILFIQDPAKNGNRVRHDLNLYDNLLILQKSVDAFSIQELARTLIKKWLLLQQAERYFSVLTEQASEINPNGSLSLLKATFESTAEGILVVDLHGKILIYNTSFLKIWKIPEAINKNEQEICQYILQCLNDPGTYLYQMQQLRKHITESFRQIVRCKNGAIIECRSQPYQTEGKIVGRVWIFHDITERTHLEQKLKFRATHDYLTGLPNRILLFDRIEQSIIAAKRDRGSFAILFFDLDRFKLINDSLSHEFGDLLLHAVAKRLGLLVRASDTLARFGGDEFVMIVSALNKPEDIVNIAHKILVSFQKPFRIKNKTVHLNASIGIALYPEDGKTAKQLLRNADLAMYYAKERGGDQFRFYINALNKQSMKRLSQKEELQRAIENNEFFLLFQPQLHPDKPDILSAEALIRWAHPQKGVILPLDFIPVAESTGLIIPLGEWVIAAACKQFQDWKAMGLPPIRIAINVAMQQLRQFDFAKQLGRILRKYRVPPQFIDVEITENLILSHREVLHMINELKELKVRIVVDDFGTERSSLNYLKTLQIDGLKIDPSFIKNISLDENDEIVIKAIISMAKNLNFDVMAEGVETQKQINFLKEHQCDVIQGYHFSKPISGETAGLFFKKIYSG